VISINKHYIPIWLAIQNARLAAVSVRVHGTERRRASVDRSDRVVT